MGSAGQTAAEWLGNGDAKRAQASFAWLVKFLGEDTPSPTGDLRGLLVEHTEKSLAAMVRYLPVCKAVERFRADRDDAISAGHSPKDLRLVQDFEAFLYLLTLGLEEGGAPDEVVSASCVALAEATRARMRLSQDQVDAMCRSILDIAGFLGSLRRPTGRTVLLEHPVGNSIPVKTLHAMLRETLPVEVLVAALSRNDSAKAGTTRADLARDLLSGARLGPDDVVVYLDEWNTGANFRRLCEVQHAALPEGPRLLAAGLLTRQASDAPRYESHCKAHDKLCSAWGTDGGRFRRILPALPSTIPGEYFFWSEHDRTAGYRKMQFAGSLFSALDQTLKLLDSDPKARKMAARLVTTGALAEAEEGYADPLEPLVEEFEKGFRVGYADYLSCRDELRQSLDRHAEGGVAAGFHEAASPVLMTICGLLDGRSAKVAAISALAYLERFGSLESGDRYYFKEHAPVIVALDGRAAAIHRTVMEFIGARVRAMKPPT